MMPKIIVIGYPILHNMAQKVFHKHNLSDNIKLEMEIYDSFLEKVDALKTANLGTEFENQRVLVAADRCSLFLQETYKLNVVPVKFSGYALLEAIKKAEKYIDKINDEVAVVNYYKRIEEIERYQDLLNIKVRQFIFNSHEEADLLFQGLKDAGTKVIIGGSNACDTAKKYGIKSIFMYSDSSVEKAIIHAAEILQAIHYEAEKAERFKTIIETVQSGIICTDNNFRITSFNKAAEKTTGITPAQTLNRHIREVFPLINLPANIDQVKARINMLMDIGQAKVLLDIIPIIANYSCTGIVLAIQDTVTIQKNEQKIRQQLYKKRLVANHTFDKIVGESPAIVTTVSKAKHFAQTDSTILITGETGTGKELFAQSIHNFSARRQKPFVAVNCAALPETLLDSELFGYEPGAFTGAQKEGKPGLFELAHTGTIFLDEVGEITPSLQSRLLRVLQEKEVMRIGGDRIIPVDVRIIAATNRNLWNEVKAGNFRKDLFYRLSVLNLNIPPLRERIEDIPYLAKSILEKLLPAVDNFLIEKIISLSMDYSWPGNVRELENILERFAVLSSGMPHKEEILYDIFWESITQDKEVEASEGDNSSLLSVPTVHELNTKLKRVESSEIKRVLEKVNGNKSAAARILGISRSTLWRKLKEDNM